MSLWQRTLNDIELAAALDAREDDDIDDVATVNLLITTMIGLQVRACSTLNPPRPLLCRTP